MMVKFFFLFLFHEHHILKIKYKKKLTIKLNSQPKRNNVKVFFSQASYIHYVCGRQKNFLLVFSNIIGWMVFVPWNQIFFCRYLLHFFYFIFFCWTMLLLHSSIRTFFSRLSQRKSDKIYLFRWKKNQYICFGNKTWLYRYLSFFGNHHYSLISFWLFAVVVVVVVFVHFISTYLNLIFITHIMKT